MLPRDPLGPLELDVLQHVADHHPVTVREVTRHFAKTSGQARTTLQTVMERLRAKGYLIRRKVGGVQRYSPKIAKADLLYSLVQHFVNEVLDGSVSPFIAYLTRSSRLTSTELRNLDRVLQKLEARERKGTK